MTTIPVGRPTHRRLHHPGDAAPSGRAPARRRAAALRRCAPHRRRTGRRGGPSRSRAGGVGGRSRGPSGPPVRQSRRTAGHGARLRMDRCGRRPSQHSGLGRSVAPRARQLGRDPGDRGCGRADLAGRARRSRRGALCVVVRRRRRVAGSRGCRRTAVQNRIRADRARSGAAGGHGRDSLHLGHDRTCQRRGVPARAVLLVGAQRLEPHAARSRRRALHDPPALPHECTQRVRSGARLRSAVRDRRKVLGVALLARPGLERGRPSPTCSARWSAS